MSCHAFARIELPEGEYNEKKRKRPRGVRKRLKMEVKERDYVLKLNIRISFIQHVSICISLDCYNKRPQTGLLINNQD